MTWDGGFQYNMKSCLYESVLQKIVEECECKPVFVNFKLKVGKVSYVISAMNLSGFRELRMLLNKCSFSREMTSPFAKDLNLPAKNFG